jgi:PAS domain S-box-containing protein
MEQAPRLLLFTPTILDAAPIEETLLAGGMVPEIACATSREEFSQRLTADAHDLILVDDTAAGASVFALFSQVRQTRPDTPFIFISSQPGEEAAIEALKRGATDYVVKQHLSRLVLAVRRALAEAAERAARRQAEQTLVENDQRLRLAIDAAEIGFWEWDIPRNRIRRGGWHDQLFGLSPTSFSPKREAFRELIYPEDRARVDAAIENTRIKGLPYDLEFRIVRADGELRWMRGMGKLIRDQAGQPARMVGTVRDITERKQAEETRLAAFLNHSATIAWLKDEEGRLVYLSSNSERRFGVRAEDWLGKTDHELWPREMADQFRQNDLAVLASGKTMEVCEESVSPKGRRSWWLNSLFPFRDAAGKRYVGGLGVDITDRVRAEAQLQDYAKRLAAISHRILQVQEEERRLIAQELHDELGQVLSAIKMNLGICVKLITDPSARARLDDSLGLIDNAIAQVRDTSLNLRPSALDFGLVPALRWFLERQAERDSLRFELHADPSTPRCDPETEAALFRVMQEAVTNVIRHAQASSVLVQVKYGVGWIAVEVRDDGQGFTLSEVDRQEHFGLTSMQERMSLIGGTLTIRSAPGEGTQIVAQAPLG